MTKSQITAETAVFYLTFLIEGNAKFQLMINENKTFLRPGLWVGFSHWTTDQEPLQ